MKLTAIVRSLSHLEEVLAAGIDEIIIEPECGSRASVFSGEDIHNAIACRNDYKSTARVFWQWDCFATDSDLSSMALFLKSFSPSSVDAFRVQDPGVALWLTETWPTPIHWIAQTGNRNLPGLQAWSKVFASHIQRLVLSHEIPCQVLADIVNKADVECEILGFGDVEIFYSRRPILKPILSQEDDSRENETHDVKLSSPLMHHTLRARENSSGFFLYSGNTFFVLDNLKDLQYAGLHAVRVEPFSKTGVEAAIAAAPLINAGNHEALAKLKEYADGSVFHGFFRVNRSDVLFDHLGGNSWRERDSQWIGELVDNVPHVHLGLKLVGPVKAGERLSFHGRGSMKTVRVPYFIDRDGTHVKEVERPGFWKIPWASGLSQSMLIFRSQAEE